MPVLSTGAGADGDQGDGDPSTEQLRGFRKRWAARSSGSPSEPCADDLQSENFSMEHVEAPSTVKRTKSVEHDMGVAVVDRTVDEFVDQLKPSADASARRHKLERDALLGTDLNVFKYPWEKGRLAKIFGRDPLVPAPNLSLKPGGANPVSLSVDVDAGGSMSAKAVVQPLPSDAAVFLQVVRKMDDVATAVDKQQKRSGALQGFWKLLSVCLTASTVGLKVSVEATMDTVNDVALKILDAIFAVKSPGTLHMETILLTGL